MQNHLQLHFKRIYELIQFQIIKPINHAWIRWIIKYSIFEMQLLLLKTPTDTLYSIKLTSIIYEKSNTYILLDQCGIKWHLLNLSKTMKSKFLKTSLHPDISSLLKTYATLLESLHVWLQWTFPVRIPKKINVTKLQNSQLTKTFKRVIINVILKRVIIVSRILKFLTFYTWIE